MNYKIKGHLIKSENTALSYKRKSRYLRDLLLNGKKYNTILDYGCGKLRYSDELINISNFVIFLDSYIQISRKQKIHGIFTTVKDYVNTKYKNNAIVVTSNYLQHNRKFADFILCSNVLSAIPKKNELTNVLLNIKSSLLENGIALFTLKYKDAKFNSFKNRKISIKHFYGHIIESRNSYHYYGIIEPDEIKKLLILNQFSIEKTIINKGSIYIYAK